MWSLSPEASSSRRHRLGKDAAPSLQRPWIGRRVSFERLQAAWRRDSPRRSWHESLRGVLSEEYSQRSTQYGVLREPRWSSGKYSFCRGGRRGLSRGCEKSRSSACPLSAGHSSAQFRKRCLSDLLHYIREIAIGRDSRKGFSPRVCTGSSQALSSRLWSAARANFNETTQLVFVSTVGAPLG